MSVVDFLNIFTNSAAINNMILVGFIFAFAFIFMLESRDPKSLLSWTDLLLDPKSNRVSVAKFGQFWGIAVSTWVIIFMTQEKEAYGIFPIVFPMYLAFIGGTWSYNAWLKSKQPGGDVDGVSNDSKKTPPAV